MDEDNKSKEMAASPSDSGSNSHQPLLNIRIKQEPGIEPYDVSPVPITPQTQSFLGHFRARSYSRLSHASSPDTAVCEVCQCEFPNYESLQLHKMAHFNTNHVCYVCDCYFWKADTLNLHMATIHRELNIANHSHKGELFVCTICLQRFSSNKTLVKHQNQHAKNDENFFGCRVCGLDFIGYRALLAHLNSPRHKEMKVKIQSIFVCVDCRSIFASRDSYAMHMMVRAQNESCDAISSTSLQMSMEAAKRELLQNEESARSNGGHNHNNGGADAAGDGASPLNLSLSRLEREKIATSFMLRHPEAIPAGYKCNMCGTYYPTQDALAMHAMSHATSELHQAETKLLKSLLPRQHKCSLCLAHFQNADSLAMHAMMHAKDEAERDVTRQQPPAGVGRYGVSPGGAGVKLSPGTVELRPSSAPLPAQQLGMKRPETRCSMCDVSFDSRDEYAMHFIDTHVNDNKNNVIPNKNTINGAKVDAAGADADAEPGMKRCHSVDDASEQGLKKMRKIKDQDEEEKTECAVCCKEFTKLEMLEHRLDCKSAAGCSTCDMGFRDEFALSCHLKSHHHQLREKKLNGLGGEKIKCHICGFMAEHEEQYMGHMYMHNPSMSESGPALSNHARPASTGGGGGGERGESVTEGRPRSAGILERGGECEARVGSSTLHHQARRSRRKPRASARVLPNNLSPEPVDSSWMEGGDSGQHVVVEYPCGASPAAALMRGAPLLHAACSPRASPAVPSSSSRQSVPGECCSPSSPRPSTTTTTTTAAPPGQEEMKDADIVDYVLSNVDTLTMCKFCKIIYTDQTMYYLHMGLHNLNNPWQCNLCGKACRNVHEFSSHVIHY